MSPLRPQAPDTWIRRLLTAQPAATPALSCIQSHTWQLHHCLIWAGYDATPSAETPHSTDHLSAVPLTTPGPRRSSRAQAGHMWSSSQPWAAWPWLTFQPRHQPHHSQHQPVAPHTPDYGRLQRHHLSPLVLFSRAATRLPAVQVVVVMYRKVLWGGTRGWEVQRGLWALTAWQSRCRVRSGPACSFSLVLEGVWNLHITLFSGCVIVRKAGRGCLAPGCGVAAL